MTAPSNRLQSAGTPALASTSRARESDAAADASPASVRIVIDPRRLERNYWKDTWRYRELFYFLAWRDILVRYKQTTIGILWAVLRPLLTMLILAVVFGAVGHFPSDGAPYPVVVFAALLPWQLFASALSDAGASLVNNSNMITKVYFPRIVLPTSAVAVSCVDFLLSSAIFVGLMAWYGYWPSWRVVTLPLFVLFAVAAALGPAIWFSALTVRYRDFRHVVPFIVQLGLYVSPVGFTSSVVPARFRLLYSANPMVGVIDSFRWALVGGNTRLYGPGFLLSLGLVAALLATGVIYFRRTERSFADVV